MTKLIEGNYKGFRTVTEDNSNTSVYVNGKFYDKFSNMQGAQDCIDSLIKEKIMKKTGNINKDHSCLSLHVLYAGYLECAKAGEPEAKLNKLEAYMIAYSELSKII